MISIKIYSIKMKYVFSIKTFSFKIYHQVSRFKSARVYMLSEVVNHLLQFLNFFKIVL